jgi:hypothetical protein
LEGTAAAGAMVGRTGDPRRKRTSRGLDRNRNSPTRKREGRYGGSRLPEMTTLACALRIESSRLGTLSNHQHTAHRTAHRSPHTAHGSLTLTNNSWTMTRYLSKPTRTKTNDTKSGFHDPTRRVNCTRRIPYITPESACSHPPHSIILYTTHISPLRHSPPQHGFRRSSHHMPVHFHRTLALLHSL